MTIVGAVLAAGMSSRMGRPKALLRGTGGETFVGMLAASLIQGGVSEVLVVGRPEDSPLRTEVERLRSAGAGRTAVAFIENRNAASGQLSSVLAALDAAEARAADALLVVPVDVPLVTSRTVARLLELLRVTPAPIVRAAYEGRHGHPVIFTRAVFDELRRADPAVGARAVVRAHAGDVVDLEVDEPGVVEDVDTPEDYRRLFGA